MRGQGETGVHEETSSGLLLRCQEGLQAETQGRVQAAVRPGAEADLRPRLRDQVREHLGASLPPGAPHHIINHHHHHHHQHLGANLPTGAPHHLRPQLLCGMRHCRDRCVPRARLGGMLGGRDGGVQQGRALELSGASVLTFVICYCFEICSQC